VGQGIYHGQSYGIHEEGPYTSLVKHINIIGTTCGMGSCALSNPYEEQAEMFAMRRRTRYGCVSAFHNMLWCVVGPHSTDAVERIATQKYAGADA
jgi:hypothetical protein